MPLSWGKVCLYRLTALMRGLSCGTLLPQSCFLHYALERRHQGPCGALLIASVLD